MDLCGIANHIYTVCPILTKLIKEIYFNPGMQEAISSRLHSTRAWLFFISIFSF